MSIKINATIHSIIRCHPSAPPENIPDIDNVTDLYYMSYIDGYSINLVVDGNIINSYISYDDTLINDILRFLKLEDRQVDIIGYYTSNKVFKISKMIFPETFKSTQYVDVIEIYPMSLISRKCSKEVYDNSTLSAKFNNTNLNESGESKTKIFTISDPFYTGQPLYSIGFIPESRSDIKYTEFDYISYTDYLTIKEAIKLDKPVKARFRVTQSTYTLISIEK